MRDESRIAAYLRTGRRSTRPVHEGAEERRTVVVCTPQYRKPCERVERELVNGEWVEVRRAPAGAGGME